MLTDDRNDPDLHVKEASGMNKKYLVLYGATFCVACRAHFPVGENGEFRWDDGQKVGT